MTLTRTAV